MRRALGALAASRTSRRRVRLVAAALAGAFVLLAIAAGALAGAGALHLRVGKKAQQARASANVSELALPDGASGILAVVDGRLWLRTRKLRLEGLPVASAALSPHALYVAAGIGTSLVAMAPSGTRAWSYRTGGRVVAIAWAPDGLRIAYVVARRRRFELRTIEGDGDHDRVLDPSVRPAPPSWRADSLAVAYVGSGGRAVVYDFAHMSHRTVRGSSDEALGVAFAPRGTALAVAGRGGLRVAGAAGLSRAAAGSTGSVVAWVGNDIAVVRPSGRVRLYRPVRRRAPVPAAQQLSWLRDVTTASASGARVIVAVEPHAGSAGVLSTTPGSTPQAETLLGLPRGARVAALAVR